MQPKVFLKKCSSIQKTLFDMQMSDNAVDILVNLSMLESDVNSLMPYYHDIKEDFIEITEYDLKNLLNKIEKIKMYIREIDRPVEKSDSQTLHELVNLMFETYVNEWSDKVYKLNRLEHEAFYLAKGSKYEEAIPKFREYLAYMNNNPFLYIKIWLAHDEYVECLHQCRQDPKFYDTYMEALSENIRLYEPCHKRLQKDSIRAKKYLHEIVKN